MVTPMCAQNRPGVFFTSSLRGKNTPGLFLLALLLMTGCAKSARQAAAPLVIWHWMTDRDPAFQELARRYHAQTGRAVRFELYAPSELYAQKIRAAAQTDTLPHIFGVLGETRDLASFVKSGYVADLTEPMEAREGAWRGRFFQKALDNGRFAQGNAHGVASGIYGVPLDVTNIQLIINKKLWAQAGLDPNQPPKTWQELLDAGRQLRQARVPGFVSGWGETWLIDCFASNYAWNILGREKILQTIAGEVPYTDPDWVKVLGLFRQLRESGLLVDGVVSMVNKRAEQLFANGQAAITFNGSWGVNVYHGMNPSLEYVVVTPPPYSDRYPITIWGGAGSSFYVNAHSPRRAEAIAFLQWLTDEPQEVYLVEATRNLPSNQGVLRQIPPALAQFADDMDKTIHPSQLPAQEFSQVVEAFDKGIQSILIGEKTPEQVARDVQQVKERELRRRAASPASSTMPAERPS